MIQETQDTAQWQALLNTIMEPWIAYKEKNLSS
jgi:hypothetical protein